MEQGVVAPKNFSVLGKGVRTHFPSLGTVSLFIYSFFQQTFIDHLLCARYVLGTREIDKQPTGKFIQGPPVVRKTMRRINWGTERQGTFVSFITPNLSNPGDRYSSCSPFPDKKIHSER